MASDEKRGEKTIVVILLWAGTLAAIVGLWSPDWVRPLAGVKEPFLGSALFRTPALTYVGEILLWAACVMVVGFYVRRGKAILFLGLFSTILAVVSSILALFGLPAVPIMVLTAISLFLATFFIFLALQDALGKLDWFVLLLSIVGLILGLAYSVTGALAVAYAMNATYTITWLVTAISVVPSHYQAMVEARKKKSGKR